jgi:hypothetical protein
MLAHAFGTRVAAAGALRRAAFSTQQKIHYTHTDEAPMLATYALLPIIKRFTVPVRVHFALPRLSRVPSVCFLFSFCSDCLLLSGTVWVCISFAGFRWRPLHFSGHSSARPSDVVSSVL